MAISDLILQLQHATGPNNDLDISIGIVAGYKREVQMLGEDDQKARKVVWLYPKNGGEAPLPRFTENLEDAYLLARTVLPGSIGGVSWDEEGGTAKIDDGPYYTAATPALALCIAALSGAYAEEEALETTP
ncbi:MULTISPECIES: hypothetical protein [unclassified Rhizobium]|uniref:hypothetical protein n=1 Tax=unclassified Rhizobium TaxID=2613769 RepID=UPI0006F8C554|nr:MULTISPECIES: hypothetical protein [unclassified Rhizobium]KQV43991.1 hypothetical protein ASC86_04160 [Rhizobium sp. Root1212]KRD38172.1 hypothetical protein ASE37_04160 [Rhizobium sp. Root268]